MAPLNPATLHPPPPAATARVAAPETHHTAPGPTGPGTPTPGGPMRDRRPVLLELFAGQGGATAGYQAAGWDVYAVDLDPNVLRRNPAQGVRAGDALVVLGTLLAGGTVPFTRRDGTTVHLGLEDFDAIHASPPCQGYSIATAGNPEARGKYRRLIAVTRELMAETCLPWVIENVEQARSQDA